MKLGRLFSSLSIGTMEIKNRIVMPPMATHYASPEGFVTERQIAYYLERARGGVGYITVEHTGILQQGKASPKMLLISSDEHASRIQKLIEVVHKAGGKIVVQINHAGRQTSSTVTGSPLSGHLPYPARPELKFHGNFPGRESRRSPKHLQLLPKGSKKPALMALKSIWPMGTLSAPSSLLFPIGGQTSMEVISRDEPGLP